MEGGAPGTDLQGEEGDCADEDSPTSPSGRTAAAGGTTSKEDDEADGTDDETSASTPPPLPSVATRLNPTVLRDAGPPDR